MEDPRLLCSPLRGPQVNDAGHLVVGGCDALSLVERWGTPLHLLDEAWIRAQCRAYHAALAARVPAYRVIYAGKAFLTTGFCRLLQQEGMSLDVVSGGELETARAASFPPADLWFHGNNKSPSEIAAAAAIGVGCFVVDSLDEIDLLQQVASASAVRLGVQVRLTPGIKPSTHSYVQTGQLDSKFGLSTQTGQAEAAVRRVLASQHLELRGLHCHIGSQIYDLGAFEEGARAVVAFVQHLRDACGYVPREVNLGGGLGIAYLPGDAPPAVDVYVERLLGAFTAAWSALAVPLPTVMVEPGRSIVGEAGVTLYRVGTLKRIPGVRLYASVDGGMTDNPRAALYQAKYHGRLANRMRDEAVEPVAICGKCCETGDMVAWDVPLPRLEVGDVLAIFSTGAYHYAMSSNYNRIPRGPVLLVEGGRSHVLVRGQTLHDLLAQDAIPSHLG